MAEEPKPEDKSLADYWRSKNKTANAMDGFIAGRNSGDIKHVKARHKDGKTYDVFSYHNEEFEVERK